MIVRLRDIDITGVSSETSNFVELISLRCTACSSDNYIIEVISLYPSDEDKVFKILNL